MITFFIPFLIKNFPGLKLIHIFRDGRSTALSYAKKEFKKLQENPEPYKKKGYFYDFKKLLAICSKTWQEHIFEIEKQKKELKLKERNILHELKYEDYCNSPKEHLIDIANFCNIDFDRFGVKDFSDIKSMNYKYRTELDEKDIEEITQIMAPALKLKGYLSN
jgi:hypothetical protein